MTVTVERAAQHAVHEPGALSAFLQGDGSVQAVAQQLGAPVGTPFLLAAFVAADDDRSRQRALTHRMRLHAQTVLQSYRSTAAVAAPGTAVYVCVPVTAAGGTPGAQRLLGALHDNLEVLVPCRAAASSPMEELHQLGAARRAVDELLSLSERRGWTGLTSGDDVDAAWRLQQISELLRDRPHLIPGRLLRVVDYDRDKGRSLLGTLRTWFACGGCSEVTASRLDVHVNTVRYRLRRIQEIAGISFEDPDDRFLAELQLRTLDA